MKVLGIPVSGIPNKDSIRNLSKQQYQRLQEALWLLDQGCTQVLAQLVMNKAGEQGRSIYQRMADSLTKDMPSDYLTTFLEKGTRTSCLCSFVHLVIKTQFPVTYESYNDDKKTYMAETGLSMVHAKFSIVAGPGWT